ncbi:MAG: NAD(P)-dependent oxidoreductase, partial [Chloroflexi bacterium]|nr:NAD(P)-dependent oxidoreductase [Chloroflexota bacterium]
PMASNLLKAGFPVTVYDINPAPVEALAAEGARKAANPAEAARGCDLFVTMVVNDAQFAAILFEPGNAAASLKPGATVIGMSTMNRTTVQSIARQLNEMGIHFLDAPVSGGEKGALAASLTIMAGGPSAVFEACRPALLAMGSNTIHVGANVGDGQAVKLINQLMVGTQLVVAAEALAFGEKLGLDRQMLFEIIGKSAGGSWIFSDRGPRMLSEAFSPPKSALAILNKDMGYVVDAANREGFPLLLPSIAQQVYKMGMAMGYGKLDDSVLIKVVETLAGTDKDGAN